MSPQADDVQQRRTSRLAAFLGIASIFAVAVQPLARAKFPEAIDFEICGQPGRLISLALDPEQGAPNGPQHQHGEMSCAHFVSRGFEPDGLTEEEDNGDDGTSA